VSSRTAMPARRPTPLCEELLEPPRMAPTPSHLYPPTPLQQQQQMHSQLQNSASQGLGRATLLGRTSMVPALDKKPQADMGVFPKSPAPVPEVGTSVLPPETMQHLLTPLAGQAYPWCPFTPMATPSPSARSLYTQCRWSTTPGARLAAALAATRAQAASEYQQPMLPQKVSLEVALRDPAASKDADHAESGDSDDSDSEEQQQQQQQQRQQQLQQAERGPMPAQPPGALHPSVGSLGHVTGTCKRCCFFPRGRCTNGYACEFCHYQHEKRKRTGKKKNGTRKVAAGLVGQLSLSNTPLRSLAPTFQPTGPVMMQMMPPQLPQQAMAVQGPDGQLHMLQAPMMQQPQQATYVAAQAGAAFQMQPPQQLQFPQQLHQAAHQMQTQQMQAQQQMQMQQPPQAQHVWAAQPQSAGQPVIMLEPAFMPQVSAEVPPPPMQPPNFWRQGA